MAAHDIRPNALDSPLATLRQALGRLRGNGIGVTTSAPHVRAATSVDRVLLELIVASVPALVIGAAAAGAALIGAVGAIGAIDVDTLPDDASTYVRLLELAKLELGQIPLVTQALVGLALFLPVLATAAAVSLLWAWLFAVVRRRSIDAGWLVTAWLFALLMPPTVPLYLVAIGTSFGVVLGQHVFGGTGHYLVSPALLGAVSVQVAYPSALGGPADLAAAFTSTWDLLAASDAGAPSSWLQAFIGREVGTFGAPSALACYAGAAYLCYRRVASVRIVVGALAAAAVCAALVGTLSDPGLTSLPWYGHLAVGNLAFVVAFIATDPTTSPTTRAGRWVFGALVGSGIVLVRLADPAHPESSLVVSMLCMLTIPLIDHVTVRYHIRRRMRRGRQT